MVMRDDFNTPADHCVPLARACVSRPSSAANPARSPACKQRPARAPIARRDGSRLHTTTPASISLPSRHLRHCITTFATPSLPQHRPSPPVLARAATASALTRPFCRANRERASSLLVRLARHGILFHILPPGAIPRPQSPLPIHFITRPALHSQDVARRDYARCVNQAYLLHSLPPALGLTIRTPCAQSTLRKRDRHNVVHHFIGGAECDLRSGLGRRWRRRRRRRRGRRADEFTPAVLRRAGLRRGVHESMVGGANAGSRGAATDSAAGSSWE